MRPARSDVPKLRKIGSPSSEQKAPPRHSYIARTERSARAIDPRLAEAAFYVWVDGSDPIGPVSADQIARGVRAGKVPSDASVRHETEVFWTDLVDQALVVEALKDVSIETETPPPESLRTPCFLVWVEGSDAVGPVSALQIARGIRAGKVPSHASVQRIDDFFSRDLLDEPDIIAALKSC